MRAPRPALRLQAVAVAVVGTLLVGLAVVAARRSDGGDGAPVALGTRGPSAAPGVVADLDRRIFTPPAPYVRRPDGQDGLGSLDLVGVLGLTGGDRDAQQQAAVGLQRLGFETAVGHAWQTQGSLLVVLVYRFTGEAGARGLVEAVRSDPPGRPFTSRTLPSAATTVSDDGASERQVGSFARKRYVYEVTLVTRTTDEGHARFDQLLRAVRDHSAAVDP